MKFGFSIEKKGKADLSRAKGHNERLHETSSQLPAEQWLSKEGLRVLVPWNDDLANQAKSLAKRKDAVVGIELSIQVGNQSDWRHLPTSEYPAGKPKNKPQSLKKLTTGALEAVYKEFGKERVISAVLHLDESTPHVQVVIAPIKDGKLNAKHWLNGAQSCAALRERIHATFNKSLPCTYEKNSNRGGEKHDANKRAGATPPKPSGLLENISEFIDKNRTVAELKQRVVDLETTVQKLFSQIKLTTAKHASEVDKLKDEVKAERDKTRKAEAEHNKTRDKLESVSERYSALVEEKFELQQQIAASKKQGNKAGLDSQKPK